SSTGLAVTRQWGVAGDVPAPGRYDNDGRTDFAVWRPSDGIWYVINSSTGVAVTRQWGVGGDIPAPGNYDFSIRNDFAVWRPSNGTWYIFGN
ncbi:hypothetical protein, partial [Nostoc sp.]|uniref:hypothetical protein n=1 Tax=Nostoc sp. TaxID=1180 RepID=UPI002FFAADBE